MYVNVDLYSLGIKYVYFNIVGGQILMNLYRKQKDHSFEWSLIF